jgi:hypothetical protein
MMTSTISTRFQLRRDISANWTNVNPKLLPGELGLETDTGKIKIGNDNNWNSITSYIGDVGAIANINSSIVTLQSKLTNFVSVKDFGATGTGALIGTVYTTLELAQAYYGSFVTSLSQTLDWAGIQKAINTGNLSIYIPSGTYVLNSDKLTVNTSNLRIYGNGSTSIIRSNNIINILELQTCSNVTFTDIAFTGNRNQTSSTDGVIRSNSASIIDNVTFDRCLFTTTDFGHNVGYFPTTNSITNLRFVRCKFTNIGRNAIEVNSTGGGNYRGIIVEQCNFSEITESSILLKGAGSQCFISSNVFSDVKLAITLQGANDTTVSFNKFKSFKTSGSPLVLDGTIEMNRNVITGNASEGSAPSDTIITQQRDLVLSGNYFLQSGDTSVEIADCRSLRISNEQYVNSSSSAATCILTGTVTDSTFTNCNITNDLGNSLRFVNPSSTKSVTNSVFTNCNFTHASGGTIYTTQLAGSATSIENPKIYLSTKIVAGVTTIVPSDPIPAGNNWRYSLTKSVVGGTSTSIEVDFGTSSTSVPACVSLRVMSSKSDGSFNFKELRYWIVHITGTVTVNTTTAIGGALTLTTSSATNKLTITAAEGSSGTYTFLWDIDVDSVNVPIVV